MLSGLYRVDSQLGGETASTGIWKHRWHTELRRLVKKAELK